MRGKQDDARGSRGRGRWGGCTFASLDCIFYIPNIWPIRDHWYAIIFSRQKGQLMWSASQQEGKCPLRKPKSSPHFLSSRSLAEPQNWLPCLISQPLPIDSPPLSCHKHMYMIGLSQQAGCIAESAPAHCLSSFSHTRSDETARGRSKFCRIWGLDSSGYPAAERWSSKLVMKVTVCLGQEKKAQESF